MRDHSLFKVIPYLAERLAAVPIMEVAHPAPHRSVDLIDHPLKGHDRPLSSRQLGDPVFDLLTGFLRGLHMGIPSPRPPSFAHLDREKGDRSIF